MDAHGYFHLICLPYTQNTCTRIIILAHSCTLNDVYSHNDTRKSLYRISRILSDTFKKNKKKTITQTPSHTQTCTHIHAQPPTSTALWVIWSVFNKHINTNTNTREREREGGEGGGDAHAYREWIWLDDNLPKKRATIYFTCLTSFWLWNTIQATESDSKGKRLPWMLPSGHTNLPY